MAGFKRDFARVVWEKDLGKLLDRHQKAEAAHSSASSKPEAKKKESDMSQSEEPDEGSERALEVLERLLRDWQEGRREV